MEAIGSKPTKVNDDNQIIAKILGGDKEAFAALVNKYHRQLLKYTLSLVSVQGEAEDIVQESFDKAFRSLNGYDPKYSFSTWLFSIAKNRSIDYLRKNQIPAISLSVEDGSEIDCIQEILSPEEQMVANQGVDVIVSQIDILPEQYRTVSYLRFIKEYAYEDIAIELSIPVGTVKTRLNRARKILGKALIK